MAAVITSRDASSRFAEDPARFSDEFSLGAVERAMLDEMGDDLTSLTGSFVTKRCGTLRWNARRTLELLGGEGEELLEDYVEEHPQSGSFRADAAAFGDFVIARTAARPRRRPFDRVVSEMARYERHRSASFWDATSSVADRAGASGEQDKANDPDKPEGSETVVLVAGAKVGHFALDMRLPFRRWVRPWYLLPEDPCDLLFFHCRDRAQLRTLRLRPLDSEIIRGMDAGRPVTIASLRAGAPPGADVDHLLRTLSWEEAIEWR